MTSKAKSLLLAAGLALTSIVTAQAQDLLTGANEDEILTAAKTLGAATLSHCNQGDPVIDGLAGDTRYQIYFRNCTASADCEDLNFYAGFSARPDLEAINTWNRDKRFSRAYLDDVGDAAVEMDLDLVKGVTADYLASQIALWSQVVDEFSAHIGY
ncbi:MAG: YbjN domain-containing protein [Candidatus Devosia phytovorans]|uniref:YbjN domain-containing protein n=1 Tax=Candidatus Devosia phytovorans TaxID=3121372 RepID=A0AAJ5VVT3_9HYPH|nr:YbjN domain-containing protein [Devosia sp.]WEK05833.1 MAG: YbjN domain-containing protein [Devosia sp.]